MRVLGIVTARGGSKGIPGKNLAPLANKPLLAYTAEAALASRRLTRTVLSTDDPKIAEAGRELGLDVPFLRPAELAKDDTPTVPVLQDVVRKLDAAGERYDAVLVLQPTNPLRTAGDIDGAIDLMQTTGADSVISFADVGERIPGRMKQIDGGARVLDPSFAEHEVRTRQELPKWYCRDGAVYLVRTGILMEQGTLKGGDCRAWVIPEERSWSVNTRFDLFVVEQILKARECGKEF